MTAKVIRSKKMLKPFIKYVHTYGVNGECCAAEQLAKLTLL